MTRRIGAMGTLVWDTNWHPAVAMANAPLEQWGGAVYSLTALSASCPAGWEVQPIIKVGADLYLDARLELQSFPHIALEPGFQRVWESNNRVELRYLDSSRRDEILSGGVPPWTLAELDPIVRGQDALYVNFLSGSEMELATARDLRERFPGAIYADLHSLFLEPPSGGPRVPRPLPDWEQWIRCFDIIQLNETELGLLAGRRDPEEMMAELLRLGPALVVVTLGGRGVRYLAAAQDADSTLRWNGPSPESPPASGEVPPPFGTLEGDPTGCGDVFGATLFTGLLAHTPLEWAVERAQILAAVKMRHPDTRTLREEFVEALKSPGVGW